MSNDLSSGLLVVTGGSAGIGASTAGRFLREGWRVLSLSRRPCPAKGAVHLPLSFEDPSWETTARDAFAQHLPKEKSRICLLHNSAILEKDTALTLSGPALRRVFEVNVIAPAVLNSLVFPSMSAGSSILYVGSTLSEKAVKGTASYVTSKHALAGLMKATCQDLVGTGIHTVCVCPGFVDTEMLRAHVGNNPEVLRALAAMSGFDRLLQPEELAALLWTCAHTPALSGAVLHANLGQIEH